MNVRFSSGALVIALLASCFSGCGDSRAPGMIITGDGRMLSNTAENTRDEAVRSIVTQLAPQLGAGWQVTAAIPELPQYAEDARGESAGDWRWSSATVTVTCAGTGEPSATPADIERAVRAFMQSKVERAKDRLAVVVNMTGPAAAMPAPTVAPGATAGARAYSVQAGDTLADISAAFYGTTQRWRLIRDANPSVDPGSLAPGTVLQIPPAP